MKYTQRIMKTGTFVGALLVTFALWSDTLDVLGKAVLQLTIIFSTLYILFEEDVNKLN